MSKKLSDMTLEELWQLFPVRLAPHDAGFADDFAEMKNALSERLNSLAVRISHIGSTAVANIKAKPIVDILVEIPRDRAMGRAARAIESLGFLKMSETVGRMSFNFGYTENGYAEKVYHLHLRFAGDNDELYFRDFLNDHPAVAEEYESLKIELAKRFKHDRDAYTDAKTEFVRRYTERAKTLYSGRYAVE